MAAVSRPLPPAPVPDAAALLAWLPRLRRYARALRRNREDADDLVQDTLERAWSRAGLWQDVGDMRTWLFSIMHNLHVDALRRGRLDTVDLHELAPEVPVAATQGHALAMRDLDAALALLPAGQREVLLLIGLDGMAYAEVAQALGIPIGTVMSRLSRGRERLRAALDVGVRSPPRTPALILGVAALPRRPIAARPAEAFRRQHAAPHPAVALHF
ncbi:MAG: RNA polymerase sigma factor [Burkholderiales bacterium]|nr:RNA polymerase sigma factor [Burkholderiales bacterium]